MQPVNKSDGICIFIVKTEIMRILLALVLTIPVFASGQVTFDKTSVSVEKAGTIYPQNHTVNWQVSLQKHKFPTPDGDDYLSELTRRKAIQKARFPRKETNGRGGGWPVDSLPRIEKMFEGNQAGNSTPNDNNLAISNSGYLISVVNSNLYFYDMNADTLMYNNSLGAWTLPLNITNGKFDPKVIFDPYNNRFILVFLNGNSAAASRYIVCFSTSDNPMDPWNMYKLTGNPFDDNSWSDYPALALNKGDLFLTINLLTPGQSWQLGFKQTIIWQIEKRSGYEGDSTLNSDIWSNIALGGTNIRNLHPVRNARGQFENQHNMYFLSNRNFSLQTDSIFLVEVTNLLTGGNAAINIDHLSTSPDYFLTVDAPQPGGQELATNDSRVLGGIIEGNIIQFVQNSIDTATGNSAIYHGFINTQTMTCTGNIVSDSVLNFGYANIAGVSNTPGEQESIMTFEYTSPNDFPGFACIYYDGNGNYSPVKILKEGENRISIFNDPLERWGDYSGIQRRYNDPCKVWACGTYGKANTDNGTWIVEIGTDTVCASLPVGIEEPTSETLVVFPNPSNDIVYYNFDVSSRQAALIQLYDNQGRLVRDLMQDEVSEGEYRFSFNVSHLAPGLYHLSISGSKGLKETKTIVVN